MDLRDRNRRRTAFWGRREELARLHLARQETAARGGLVLVRGAAGNGKSALLDAAARTWRRTGVQVIRASLAGATDRYGFRCVADAVRDRFEQIGEPRLAAPLGVLGRSAAGDDPATRLVLELGAVFDLIRRGGPVALVVDDVDEMIAPVLALGAAVRPGCLVLAACRDGRHPAAIQLAARADHIVDLESLPEAAVEPLLTRVSGVPPHGLLVAALRNALGPLVGHPGTLLSTLDALGSANRLAVLGGQLCLVEQTAPIALPAGHRLVEQPRAAGAPAVLLATAVAVAPLPVDELSVLAEATGERLGQYGRAADELVELGVLDVDTNGWLHPRCAALASRLIADAGPAEVDRLRQALAGVRPYRDHPDTRVGETMPPARPGLRRADFTTMEREVIGLIRHGRTNRQIAVALRISEKTVENHLTRLFARTGCRSRVELAAVSLSLRALEAVPSGARPTGTAPDGAQPADPVWLGMAS
ncbi:LuxR family transcriptional regulator [Micromonospora sp. HNM0581]|uniref:AAA family ATPase n=1 Tax=Micromonospora sp. HNM0581 TaxID=2716341 RepID=UPI00197BE0D9